MPTKLFRLNDIEYSVIQTALAMYGNHHFEKSNTLKRETDAQYHREQFQKAMDAQFELREQMRGQQ